MILPRTVTPGHFLGIRNVYADGHAIKAKKYRNVRSCYANVYSIECHTF